MIQQYPLLETSPFLEFTSVKITDTFNPTFDIEKIPEENMQSYCQGLINKIFQLRDLQILDFISHHCNIAKNTIEWLNEFDKLIVVNEKLFQNGINESKIIKFQTCIELKRLRLKYEEIQKSPSRPNKKQINAESEERYFSFKKVKEKLGSIAVFEEKIVFLTHQKYDYQQSVIDFVNKNLPQFDEQCSNEISRLLEVRKLEEQFTKNVIIHSRKPISGNKIKINCNLNQLVDVFFQMNRELFIEGKPFLDGDTNDFVALICNNFVDKDGHELSTATVQTILRPSKYDKRPKSHKCIDVNKLI